MRFIPDYLKKIGPACFACALLAVAPSLSAQEENYIVWTNGGGSNAWESSSNWDIPYTPIDNEWVLINLAGNNRAVFSSSSGDQITGSQNILYLRVGEGDGVTGELEITGNRLAPQQPGSQTRVGADGGNGIITVSGGELDTGAAQNHVGLGEGSVGTINLTGGDILFGREFQGTSLFLGAEGGTGTFNISGGELRTRAGVILGSVASDGDPEDENDNGWPAGVGTFNVEGSGIGAIGIGAHQSVPGQWIQNDGSSLRVRIDEVPADFGGGVRPIDIVQYDGQGGNVTFEAGAVLDVDFLNGEIGGTWTVMRWQGELVDNGLALAPGVDTEMWSFEFDLAAKSLLVHSASEIVPDDPDPEGENGTWTADASGSWGEVTNWQDGTVASGTSRIADFNTLDISGDRTVTLDQNRTIGQVFFGDTSGENDWALGPEAQDATTEGETGLALALTRIGGAPEIHVGQDGVARIQRRLDGFQGFRKTGTGILELANPAHIFTGDVTVVEGVLRALTSGNGGLGASTVGGLENRIVVGPGATFQLGTNVQIVNKQVRLSGTGVSDGEGGTLGAFYIDATGTTNGTRWSHNGATNPAIALDADATFRIDGDSSGANTANVLSNHLNLGGFTLTKAGTGSLTLDGNGAATGVGTIHVAEGVLGLTHDDIRNGVDVIIGPTGELRGGRAPAPVNSTTNTVMLDGRWVMSSRTDTISTSQHVGVLMGSGLLTTGTFGNTGTHTLNIRDTEADSFFSGVIEEESGQIHIVKGAAADEANTSTLTLDGSMRHKGNTTVNAGALVLGENSDYTFYLSGSASSNRILGLTDGSAPVALNGGFVFDLAGASTVLGTSWSPVDTANLVVTVGETFRVVGFGEVEPGVWGRNANGVGYRFSEATLTLEVVPEFDGLLIGFAGWQQVYFENDLDDPTISGADADPDADGLRNLMEYALGGDPLETSMEDLPTYAVVDDFLEITFGRVGDANDVLYQVEASGNLADWTEVWNSNDHPYESAEQMVLETVADQEAITSASRRFLRLTVTLQE